MKRQVIAVLMSIVMASGSFGSATVFAAEVNNQEALNENEQSENEQIDENVDPDIVTEHSNLGEPDEVSDQDTTDAEILSPGEETLGSDDGKGADAEEIEGAAEGADADEIESAENGADAIEGEVATEGAGEAGGTGTEEESSMQVVASGICGDNATWTVTAPESNTDYTLTISGTGDLYNYDQRSNTAPWRYYNYIVASINVEEGITSIGNDSFNEFTNLKSVSLPASLRKIGDSAFMRCPLLSNIDLPGGLTGIGISAFDQCTSLQTISLPETVAEIGEDAFAACEALETAVLPSELTSLGMSVFMDCHNLTNVTMPTNITEIPENMFQNCTSLTRLDIPDSVTTICMAAFVGCTNLSDLELSDNVKVIEGGAFYSCTSLTSISFPEGVESVGEQAFGECTNLAEIWVPGRWTQIDSTAFYDDEQLLKCYTVHNSYISNHVPTYDGTNSVTEIIYLDSAQQIETPDPIDAWCGQTLSDLTLPDGFEWMEPEQDVGSAGSKTFGARYIPEDESGYEPMENIMITVNVEHKFSDDWNAAEGMHWHECVCGERTIEESHMPIYEEAIPATYDEEGRTEFYRCEICGKIFKDENCEIEITLEDTIIPVLDEEPVKILTNPYDVEAAAGEIVSFVVEAEGDELRYQWQWSADGSNWKNCTGTGYNTDTFSFAMKEKFAGRQYRCAVTSRDTREVTESAMLSLKTSYEIVAHPDDVEAAVGETAIFIVEFRGANPIYQWQWSSNGTTWNNCTGSGYNSDVFSFVMKAKYAGRMYRCVITEEGYTYVSDSAQLSLFKVSEFLAQPDDVEAADGDDAMFIVEFSGINPIYQWQWSTDGTTWKNCTSNGFNTNTFRFIMKAKYEGRMYRCIVTDAGKTFISNVVTLYLDSGLRFISQPEDLIIPALDTATFHVEASGSSLRYQWQWSTDKKTWKNCTSTGYNTGTFSFIAKPSYDGRYYRCRVSDGTDILYSGGAHLTVTD